MVDLPVGRGCARSQCLWRSGEIRLMRVLRRPGPRQAGHGRSAARRTALRLPKRPRGRVHPMRRAVLSRAGDGAARRTCATRPAGSQHDSRADVRLRSSRAPVAARPGHAPGPPAPRSHDCEFRLVAQRFYFDVHVYDRLVECAQRDARAALLSLVRSGRWHVYGSAAVIEELGGVAGDDPDQYEYLIACFWEVVRTDLLLDKVRLIENELHTTRSGKGWTSPLAGLPENACPAAYGHVQYYPLPLVSPIDSPSTRLAATGIELSRWRAASHTTTGP